MNSNLPHVSKSTKVILIVEFIFLAYMLYVLATSLYKSYQVDNFIATAEKENAALLQENDALTEDFEYYRSQAYKEKIVKQNLGLVRPGEEIIILSPDNGAYLTGTEREAVASEQYYNSLSNPKKWFLFFFDRERFVM